MHPPTSASARRSSARAAPSPAATHHSSIPPQSRSASPNKGSARNAPSRHAGSSDDLGHSDDDGSDEDKKLEERRYKNRVKQRNLRLRRQTHLDDLENEKAVLHAEANSLRQQVKDLHLRETALTSWIRDLETALITRGLSHEVESLRRSWAPKTGPVADQADPLSTLASAAAASRNSSGPPVRPSAATTLPRDWPMSSSLPYPTPSLSWESQVPTVWGEPSNKRRREDYFPAPPPHNYTQPFRPPLHGSTGPVLHQPQDYRPSTAPHEPVSPRGTSAGRGSLPSGGMRISDLLSPIPAVPEHNVYASDNTPRQQSVEAGPSRRPSATGSAGAIDMHMTMSRQDSRSDGGRWSVGDISVIDNSLTDQSLSIAGKQGWAKSTGLTGQIFPTFPPAFHPNVPLAESIAQAQGSRDQVHPHLALPSTLDPPLRTASPIPLDMMDGTAIVHPSVICARSVLHPLLPHPLSRPLPPMPYLNPSLQRIILLALTYIVPAASRDMFHQRQLRFLPAEDAKVLLQYQSDPTADPRIVLFPIAILRAKTVRHLMDGKKFDVDRFINDTLFHARIFGEPLDPDSWEMSGQYWDIWEPWFARGRSYCHSLATWRRRNGHTGSTVLEIILGLETHHARTTDPVGKPPNWTF